MTVRTISCDACERTRRCVDIRTARGHQIDLCRACLLEAMAAFDDASGRRLRSERMALTDRLKSAKRAVSL